MQYKKEKREREWEKKRRENKSRRATAEWKESNSVIYWQGIKAKACYIDVVSVQAYFFIPRQVGIAELEFVIQGE